MGKFKALSIGFENIGQTSFCLQKSVSEWMHKALQAELQDWQRDQEPDTDHEGFYQTSLPTIITQVSFLHKREILY